MQERDFNGLKVCFDSASIKEYEADKEAIYPHLPPISPPFCPILPPFRPIPQAFDEIFEFTQKSHRQALARFGQCPIVCIGHKGKKNAWEWGARIKEKEEGIDLGNSSFNPI